MAIAARAESCWRRRVFLLAVLAAATSGCNQPKRETLHCAHPAHVVAIAPVLNLSGSQDFDPLKVTDLIASEFLSFKDVTVIPVNLALAELQRRGKYAVETPDDALALAHALGADATIVVAIHEYNPYSPPVVGLTMQWYAGSAAGEAGMPPAGARQPRWQVQRVFNASDEDILAEVREYADDRDGHASPYGWRKYTRSQELYLRYCGWATIRTMLRLENGVTPAEPHEAKS
jgi:hypothetical protein